MSDWLVVTTGIRSLGKRTTVAICRRSPHRAPPRRARLRACARRAYPERCSRIANPGPMAPVTTATGPRPQVHRQLGRLFAQPSQAPNLPFAIKRVNLSPSR